MKKAEILAHLVEWERVQRELDAQTDLFCDLTRAQPDSDLFTAIYAVAEAHTDAVGRVVGDMGYWLDWYKFDNQWGENGFQVQPANSLKLHKISNLKQLAALIATE